VLQPGCRENYMSYELWKREELYELVWTRTLTDLATEYAISAVGLGKACVRLQIPLPGRGYWAKLKSGQKMPRAPLPPQTNKANAYKPDKRPASPDGTTEGPTILDVDMRADYEAALAFEDDPENDVNLSEASPRSELATKTLVAHSKAKKGEHQIPILPVKTYDIRVSSLLAERAVRIMDSLAGAFKTRGWELALEIENDIGTMCVTLLGFTIQVWIEELLNRELHVLTPAEEKDKQKNPWKYSRPTYDYSPSGRLALKLKPMDSCFYYEYRSTWADGKTQKVEALLASFCRGLVLSAIQRRNDQIRKEQREQEWKEREERRKEEERLRLIEEARRNQLASALEDYARMLQIRSYIEYVNERAMHDGKPIEGDLAAWIAWAEQQAAKKDPLRKEYPTYEVEPAKPKSLWG
jgi:hypothetical protein